jgi:hypothetical protein
MKTRTICLIAVFCLAAVAISLAATDTNVGTWKLNDVKSKIGAGMPKNNTVTYTAEGDSYKCVIDGTDGAGKPAHTEWTGKFDGKDYPVTGDPNNDTRAISKVDAHHYKVTQKKAGKVTSSGTITLAPDGKSRTVAITATDASGKKVTETAVYDKQ